MTSEELKRLIAQGEDSHTEFKRQLPHADDLAAALVAFANAEGGVLILGVEDNGGIIGLENTDKAMQAVDLVCYQNCEPRLSCYQEKIFVQTADGSEKLVLAIKIPKGPERPYRTNRGVYYIRTSSGRRQATREELLRLYQASFSLLADELPLPNSAFDDLDLSFFEKKFEEFFGYSVTGTGLPRETVLQNMKILASGETTVGGMLLFGRRPQNWLPFAKISVVRFAGLEISETILDRKDIEGKLADQIDGAEAWLKIHTRVSGVIKGFKREDEYELPHEVLREVLVNAVAHRDYSVRSQIRIFIFDDRVEIFSPGKLPNTLALENLRYGVHVERNPVLVSFLTKMGYMSQVGTGIPRVFRLMKQQQKPEPRFALVGEEFRVTLPKQV